MRAPLFSGISHFHRASEEDLICFLRPMGTGKIRALDWCADHASQNGFGDGQLLRAGSERHRASALSVAESTRRRLRPGG